MSITEAPFPKSLNDNYIISPEENYETSYVQCA